MSQEQPPRETAPRKTAVSLCPACGEAHQPPCPVRPCAEWEAIQAEERQERETILLREGTRRNLD